MNPFIGFTGQLHGLSDKTHRALMDSIQQNTIFTNCAITKDRDVWWEGMTKEAPSGLIFPSDNACFCDLYHFCNL